MHIHTNNRTHFSLRVSGDSQQTLALHTGTRKFICLFGESSILSTLWTGQRRLPASQTKCWQSLLNSGVTLLHGLSDGLSTLPPPLHCPYSDEIWPDLCLCCTLCHTSLSQTLPLQFPPYIYSDFFPSSLRTRVTSAALNLLFSPKQGKAAHPEERLLSSHVRG